MAAIRSASLPRRSASCTIARTAVASPSATSAASPCSETASPSLMAVAADDRMQFVFEAARLDRAVDAPLLGRAALPPPATGARRLARRDRARARPTADRRVAPLIQRVR